MYLSIYFAYIPLYAYVKEYLMQKYFWISEPKKVHVPIANRLTKSLTEQDMPAGTLMCKMQHWNILDEVFWEKKQNANRISKILSLSKFSISQQDNTGLS